MSLNITFRNVEATEALKSMVEKKVEKFKKFVSYPMDVHVLLSVTKGNHTAEITCHAEHRDLVALGKSNDLYESIDLAVHKIETQLKKEREKKKGHTAAGKTNRASAAKLGKDVGAEIPHIGKKRAVVRSEG